MQQKHRIVFLLLLSTVLTAGLGAQNFRIQVAAYADSVPRTYFTDRGVQGVTVDHTNSGLWRYLLGAYRTREEAEAVHEQLVAKGFPTPVIIDLEAQRALSESGCAYSTGRVAPVQQDEGPNPVRTIFFGDGKSVLDAKARAELDRFVVKMKADPKLQLRIMGFNDSKADAQTSYDLSAARARAARNYLINKGIRADRMNLEVYGEADPLYENKDLDGNDLPENQRWNRRVMLKFVEQ